MMKTLPITPNNHTTFRFATAGRNSHFWKKKSFFLFSRNNLSLLLLLILSSSFVYGQRPMESLDRGVVALERSSDIYLSWRISGTEPQDIGFNVYRNGSQINAQPITSSSNYVDAGGTTGDLYSVTSVINGVESAPSVEVAVWQLQPATENPGKPDAVFKRIPLPPAPTLNGVLYTAGDTGVGDLDGDGQYDLVVEWEADSVGTHSFVDAIKLDGTHLWRIGMGPNSNRGKLGMLVYDLNEDGKAEVTMITAPGTTDGTGTHLSNGPAATDDNNLVIQRNSGRLMEDPAYITVFNGETGQELTTTDYWPPIGPIEDHEETWGDNYGHRASSLKAAVLYIQGLGPVVVYSRGVYTRIAMAAYHWDGQLLNQQWTFDSEEPGNEAYRGEGNHSVSIGDLDGDGSDELIYGACAIDHDGNGLYATGFGHGDADHLGDHMPDRPGLEFFQPHENSTYGISMRDAGTGEILWEIRDTGDVGRAWAADVDPNYRGSEVVAALSSTVTAAMGSNNFDKDGNPIPTTNSPYDQPIYFDGTVQRNLRGGSNLNGIGTRILTGWYYGATTIHDSKNDAILVADILGDWREEVIFPHKNNTELLLFSTWIPTERKNYTLMHDPVYRMNIVRQSIGYNQPAHTGFYFADGAPVPDIYLIDGSGSGGGGGNVSPFANAGPDQSVTDTDEDGLETVTLDGSESSDADGSITSYIWSQNGSQLATGINPIVNLAVGTHTIRLTVEDDSIATATDDVIITVNTPGGDTGWLEAECGVVGALWNIQQDQNASNGDYATIQSGSNSTGDAPTSVDGHISYTFDVSEAGIYTVWGRVITPSVNEDSFWVRMDTGSWINWNNIAAGTSWHWDVVHDDSTGDAVVSFNLSTGTHTLTFAYREDGTQLDKVYLAKDGDVPSGIGLSAGNCGGVSNQIPLANAGPDQTIEDTDNSGSESVILDGSGSSDPDGSIASYSWTKDGSEIATGANPTANLGVGSHVITLAVTDDSGATASDEVVITITAPRTGGTATMHVQSIITSTISAGKGNKNGTATITIHDDQESPVSGATVTGTFNGTFNETVTGQTDINGSVTLTTTETAKGGVTVDFCVDDVAHSSLTYDVNRNDFTCTGASLSTNMNYKTYETIELSERSEFRLYPNPAQNRVTVELTNFSGIEMIRVTDMTGKEVFVVPATSQNTQMNVSNLPKGIYNIQVHSGSKKETKLLIKK